MFWILVRKGQMWLPGAITSAFVAFLTWSALGSQPRSELNEIQEFHIFMFCFCVGQFSL